LTYISRSIIGYCLSPPVVREETIIRARFEVDKVMPVRKVETMRPVSAVVDELVVALASKTPVISNPNELEPFSRNL